MGKYVLAAAAVGLTGCSAGQDVAAAETQVANFHRLLDSEQYRTVYDTASPEFRSAGSAENATAYLAAIHRKLGPVRKSNNRGFNVNYNTGGSFVTLTYATQFAQGSGNETFVYHMMDGKPVLAGYNINSAELIIR